MKVVIAIDSFKGCMSSVVAGNAAKHGLLSVTDAEVYVFPVADGGEGTTRVLTEGLKGIFVSVSVLVMLCIGWRVWKAANENPADVVKSE